MIQKTWTDMRIYKFCKKHKFSLFFNETKKVKDSPVYEVTRYTDRDHPDVQKILEWCRQNCTSRYVMCQWHLGYENNVFFKFFSKEDAKKYYRYYDKTFLRSIEVETRIT